MTKAVIMIGGPRHGTILTVRRLEPRLYFGMPPKLEIHDNTPVDYYTPMRMFVYKRIPGKLDYYFVGVK